MAAVPMSNALSSVSQQYLAFYRDAVQGSLWSSACTSPMTAWRPECVKESISLSMAGTPKANHFVALAATAVHEGIDGAIIECGVWRGGLSFIVAKALELQGADRLVYLADSFRGIPPPPKDGRRYEPRDTAGHQLTLLNDNSVDSVKAAATRFHLRAEALKFVVGYFNESLPPLVAAQLLLKFAVVRLDGDTYFSTMDAINVLYPRLSAGGFIIIDDFVDWPGCRAAVFAYRKKHGITAPIIFEPHPCPPSTSPGQTDACVPTFGAYWRKPTDEARPGQPWCVGMNSGGIRAAGSYLPTRARQMPDTVPPGGGLWLSSSNMNISKNKKLYEEAKRRHETLWYCAPDVES